MPHRNKKSFRTRAYVGMLSILAIITAGSAVYFSNGVLFKSAFIPQNFEGVFKNPPTVYIYRPEGDYHKFSYDTAISFIGYGTDSAGNDIMGTSLQWFSNKDGALGSGNNLIKKLSKGVHIITLTATDASGQAASANKSINVVNLEPTAVITLPSDNDILDKSAPIILNGFATDPEEGDIPSVALEWKSDRDGVLGRGKSLTVTSLSAGTHKITITAMDAKGAECETSIKVTVK